MRRHPVDLGELSALPVSGRHEKRVDHQLDRRMLADKLGLVALGQEGDDALLAEMFELLQQVETDMTLFFRSLMNVPVDGTFEAMDNAGGDAALARLTG